jgi:hypothetical protein
LKSAKLKIVEDIFADLAPLLTSPWRRRKNPGGRPPN